MNCWCGARAWQADIGRRWQCAASAAHDPLATGTREVTACHRLYISGPMSGLPLCNYPAFHAAERMLNDAGFEVVNPAGSTVKDAHYTDLLRQDLVDLVHCHGVATLPGWERSRGASHEVKTAELLLMPVLALPVWLAVHHS